jgi:hypothetical protein
LLPVHLGTDRSSVAVVECRCPPGSTQLGDVSGLATQSQGGVLHKRDAFALIFERMPLVVGEVVPAAVLALVLRSQQRVVSTDEFRPRDPSKWA